MCGSAHTDAIRIATARRGTGLSGAALPLGGNRGTRAEASPSAPLETATAGRMHVDRPPGHSVLCRRRSSGGWQERGAAGRRALRGPARGPAAPRRGPQSRRRDHFLTGPARHAADPWRGPLTADPSRPPAPPTVRAGRPRARCSGAGGRAPCRSGPCRGSRCPAVRRPRRRRSELVLRTTPRRPL